MVVSSCSVPVSVAVSTSRSSAPVGSRPSANGRNAVDRADRDVRRRGGEQEDVGPRPTGRRDRHRDQDDDAGAGQPGGEVLPVRERLVEAEQDQRDQREHADRVDQPLLGGADLVGRGRSCGDAGAGEQCREVVETTQDDRPEAADRGDRAALAEVDAHQHPQRVGRELRRRRSGTGPGRAATR